MTYCVAADVQRVLGRSTAFSGSTNPTDTQVATSILEAQDIIDGDVNHSWQTLTVTDEYYDLPRRDYGQNRSQFSDGVPIYLKHREITTLSSGSGDKVEVWNGSSYEDWLSTKTEGRADDFWLDYTKGILYLNTWPLVNGERARIRLTYRYGGGTVPQRIQRACALQTAILLAANDSTTSLIDEGAPGQSMSRDQQVAAWERQYLDIVTGLAEFGSF